MLTRIESGKSFLPDPALRGFHAVYRSDVINHCPACGRTHWYVGRLLAECSFCATALPLMDAGTTGTGLFRHHQQHHYAEAA